MKEEANILTRYLNPRRFKNSDDNYREIYHLIRIDHDFLENEQDPNSENVTKEIKNSLPATYGDNGLNAYKRINTNLPLVVTHNSTSVKCFFKREENDSTTYLSLENALLDNTNESHYLPYTNLTFIPINLGASYYYHIKQEQLYILISVFPEAIIIGQKFLDYNPKHLGGLTDGDYTLNYKDSFGFTNSFMDKIISTPFYWGHDDKYRTVNVTLNNQIGKVHWFPKIRKESGKVVLYYEYDNARNDFNVPMAENGFLEAAIRLEFNYTRGFLAFMVLTYFINNISPLDVLEEDVGFRRSDFFKKYIEIVAESLQNSVFTTIYDTISTLYYVPDEFFVQKQALFSNNSYSEFLGEDFLWSAIKRVLRIPLSNFGPNVEDITMGLFETLLFIQDYKGYKNHKDKNDYILNELLTRKYNHESYLIAFYNRMHTYNFVNYNYFIYKIWRNSSYVNPEHPIFKNTSYFTKLTDLKEEEKKKAPIMLTYKSNKLLGFYTSNIDAEFNDDENIAFTPDESSWDEIYDFFFNDNGNFIKSWVEGNWKITYHPLHPIYLPNPTEESAIRVQKISPALLIKASEDKAFWSNVGTAVSYTFDVLTTLSGFTNLAKFRHLGRIADAAGYIKNGVRLKNTFYVYKAAKGTLATIEISSGTINILLRITGLEDTPFGQALTNFLFWMEMLTLSVDLYDAIEEGLRGSAKVLTEVNNSEILSKKLDEFIEAKLIDESDKARIVDEIKEIAESASDYSTILATKVDISRDIAPKTIKGFEQSKKLEKFEHGLAFNLKTKYKAEHTSNLPNEIKWPDSIIKNIEGCIVTHNHPKGGGLSIEDLFFFISNRLVEIRAVGPDGSVFSLRNGKIYDSVNDVRALDYANNGDVLDQKVFTLWMQYKAYLKTSVGDTTRIEKRIFNQLFDLIKDRVTYTHYINK
ncbi:hypothetical protein C8N46_106288 [Kordia periserrulae]|uniref:Uncharacterized protein n=1 Tax=Kordia periserrulae TaxID=701523 RepID=A0A2T6BX36_9FLAO|nr:hypothetical protein [Kordia periserrulae]PTX60642.1 hypothetical protein C8N46_106288 [Kordia periserrulae]